MLDIILLNTWIPLRFGSNSLILDVGTSSMSLLVVVVLLWPCHLLQALQCSTDVVQTVALEKAPTSLPTCEQTRLTTKLQ